MLTVPKCKKHLSLFTLEYRLLSQFQLVLDSKYVVPASMASEGTQLSDIVKRRINAANQWSDELKVTLTISGDVFRYADPIPLQATITNSSAQPITFVRPQAISFSGGDFMPNTVVVNLVSQSGERIEGTHYSATILEIPAAPPLEAFAMLPPGESCTTEFLLDWENSE